MIRLQYDFWLFRGIYALKELLRRELTGAPPLKYCFGVAFVCAYALSGWNWAGLRGCLCYIQRTAFVHTAKRFGKNLDGNIKKSDAYFLTPLKKLVRRKN